MADQTLSSGRPDLVLFIADEFRGDVLGHRGNPAAVTPTLDAMVASDAVSFTNAYCQNPVCVPSRISMMTGWYPHVRGHRTQHHLLRNDEPNLTRRLKDSGYQVWWGGKNDMFRAEDVEENCTIRYEPAGETKTPGVPEWQHWWPVVGAGGYYSHYVGELPPEHEQDSDRLRVTAAADYLRKADRHQPVCVVLTLVTPHCPYAVPEPWYSLVNRDKVPAPTPAPAPADGKASMMLELRRGQGLDRWSTSQWRELRATYYGMCARTDALLGELVTALKETNRYDNTLLIMTSDHGDFAGDFGLPEKAQNLFEDALTNVPLVVKPPSRTQVSPGLSEAMVELIDLPALIEESCALPWSHTHFGRSFAPLLSDRSMPHRAAVLSEGGRLPGECEAMELNSKQGPAGLYHPRMKIQREDDRAHGKGIMYRTRDFKYVHRLTEPCELYDLTIDSQEKHNLIQDQTYAAIVREMKDALLSRLIETADAVPAETDHR